jgi:hypothetical protein
MPTKILIGKKAYDLWDALKWELCAGETLISALCDCAGDDLEANKKSEEWHGEVALSNIDGKPVFEVSVYE